MKEVRTFIVGATGLYLILAGARLVGIGVLTLPGVSEVMWRPGTSPIGEVAVGTVILGVMVLWLAVSYMAGHAIFAFGRFMEKQWRDLRTRK